MTTSTTYEPHMVSVAEAGRRLGLSRWTIRQYVDDGLLPAYRIGPRSNAPMRIRVDDIESLLRPVVELAESTACCDEDVSGPDWQ